MYAFERATNYDAHLVDDKRLQEIACAKNVYYMVQGVTQDPLWSEYIDGEGSNEDALKISKAVLHGVQENDDSDSSE